MRPFPHKWQRKCGIHGHLLSAAYFPVDPTKIQGLAFRFCLRCHEVFWL